MTITHGRSDGSFGNYQYGSSDSSSSLYGNSDNSHYGISDYNNYGRNDRSRSSYGFFSLHWAIYIVFVVMIIIFSLIIWQIIRRRRNRRRRYRDGPTVTVTTTQAHHVPSPQVVPPYPIDARHPTPGSHAPAPGFTTHHQAPYPTHTPNMPFPQATPVYGFTPTPMGLPTAPSLINGCYPRQTYYYGTSWYHYPSPIPTSSAATFRHSYYGQTPYPPTGPAPYPPASYPPATNDYSANPPPYDVAVAQPPIQPPQSKDGYVKQSPYNPGYN